MKKALAALLAVGLAAGVMFGCGPKKEEAAAQSAEAAVKSAVKEAAEEVTKEVVAETGGAGLKLGICLPTRDQYWTTFEGSCVANAEAAGMEAQVVECKEDISTQISQIETFKNNGFDAVIIGLSSNDSYQEAITAAGDMKIVFFNRAVTDTKCLDGKQTVYVGMAEYDAGYAQGVWLADYFSAGDKKDLKGMMFMGVLGQQSVTDRTQGAKDALKDAGYNVEWVFEDTAEWDRAKAMDKFVQFANSGKEFDFVVCNNDEMALGCIEGCTSSGKAIDFPIVGIDATEVGCNAVLEGTLQMTVNQNPIGQGEVAIDCVVALCSGQACPGADSSNIVATDAVPVTADNVEEVLATF